MHAFSVRSRHRCEFIDITGSVRTLVKKSDLSDGICHLYVPHTTAGITINENADPDVVRDMRARLKTLVPHNGSYAHREGNADAHIKSSLLGHSAMVIIRDADLALGQWQGIFFCEFDGPRTRNVWAVMSETSGA